MSHTRQTTIRLASALAGAGLVVGGVVLLLRAAWIALAAALAPMWASVILGSVLVLVGALVLALSAPRSTPRPAASGDDLIVRLTTAFFEGLTAGRSSRRSSDRSSGRDR